MRPNKLEGNPALRKWLRKKLTALSGISSTIKLCNAPLKPVLVFNPLFSVRRERRRSSVGESPTRQLSLRPVAIGVAVEAMKPLKPLVKGVTNR